MLPSRLAYQTKIEASAARSQRSNIAPQNGTDGYSANDTIIFNLPTRNNLVFVPTESYLKFTPTITNGATGTNAYFRFDSMGAHGFIRKIRVFHGSNLLEDIDNYEVLAKMIFDMQASSDASRGKLNILAGTDANYYIGSTYTAAAVADLNNNNTIKSVNQGALLTDLSAGALAASTSFTTQTYCLNLISMIGTLCNEKYFPLFACTSAPIRVEITLAPSLNNVLCTERADCTFELSNVEFIMNTIELSDDAMGIINSSLSGQPLQFVTTEYRNQPYTGTGSTSYAVPLPFKFSSVKSIIIASRNNTTGTGAATYFPCSSCTHGLSSYYFRIGPNTVPSKAPTKITEFFAEAVKAMGSMSDIHYNPAIDYNSFSLAANTATTDTITASNNVQSGSFYVGLDLENFATADRTNIFAGYVTNTEDIFYYPTFAAAADVRFDAFCMYDQVIVFENGTCYVKY